MGFNSAFKGLKLLKKKTRERAFKQFKWPLPQCVKINHLKPEALSAEHKTLCKWQSVRPLTQRFLPKGLGD